MRSYVGSANRRLDWKQARRDGHAIGLKNFNTNHAPIFINEDLTATRSAIAAEARQLKKNKKILATWTAAGNILVKTLLGTIVQIKSKADLAQY